ncbi:MAG: dihydrolipoyl dehydrogenase [Gammaproteobacteria bacterium]|nr:dihydrolipoyl dehydrogenase [Gammaproteobacteria bacterium]
MSNLIETEIVVLGAGPGGYSAAFRAADLGKQVVLVERYPDLGGVCLNVGCIPSKALLHVAKVMAEVNHLDSLGVSYGNPTVDLDKVRTGKEKVVKRLTGGLAALAKQRKVQVVQGTGEFSSASELQVTTPDGVTTIRFQQAIIAVGSSPTRIPGLPYDDSRLMDSTGALALEEIPPRLLVIGGGYIGLEMATVYAAIGSEVSVVEFMPGLLPGADPDLVKPLAKKLKGQLHSIMLGTKVAGVDAGKEGLTVRFEGDHAPEPQTYDRVLVSVGRKPNTDLFGADKAGIKLTDRGFIEVDECQRTSVPNIYAIGDIVGDPMLAHKAVHEGKVAAEVIAGLPSAFDPRAIPAVVFTDPEIAWAGLTEADAKANNISYEKGVFPWAASGRALAVGGSDGFTKTLFDPETKRLLGIGIVGPNAGDLVAEGVLAMEMGADAEDIGLTIHPHPTLSETVGMSAEVAEGSVTDIIAPKQ